MCSYKICLGGLVVSSWVDSLVVAVQMCGCAPYDAIGLVILRPVMHLEMPFQIYCFAFLASCAMLEQLDISHSSF